MEEHVPQGRVRADAYRKMMDEAQRMAQGAQATADEAKATADESAASVNEYMDALLGLDATNGTGATDAE